MNTEHLNPEQAKAVNTINGPVLIIAGAGSGKTRVITFRIAHMLESGIPQSQILALTFTNKAAREMEQRIKAQELIKLFTEHPDVLAVYKNRYRYVMVDEFQDTSIQQYQMMHLIADDNVCVVGDDDQSIYSWRGAFALPCCFTVFVNGSKTTGSGFSLVAFCRYFLQAQRFSVFTAKVAAA